MKALVLSSGGIDSTTLLAMAIEKHGKENVISLTISYGQKHDKEIKAAEDVANDYQVRQIFLDLGEIFKDSKSALLKGSDENIPKESYERQIEKTKGESPVSTYVPFRNGLFISSAASVALSNGCEIIYYGIHADDAAGAAYPDCTEEFNEAMKRAVYLGSGNALTIEAPFVKMTKAEIVKLGLELKVPYELTWSCYEGGDKPCGKCGTCIDRAKAFELNGAIDPAL